MAEIGYTGLSEWSGQIQEDFLRELRGQEGYKRYNEMRLNSPVIGALLSAIELAIRGVTWQITAEDADETDERIVFANDAFAKLNWNDHISEALTMLPFGYSLFEIVYRRDGERLVWAKFAPRGQDTVYRWQLADNGDIEAVVQQGAPAYKTITLPADKLIIYRLRAEKNNPEGRSLLRQAWIPYYYAKTIMQVEGIGIERDLAGLPVITLPPGATTEDTDTSDFGKARKIVRNIRNDEQAGVVLPSPEWKLELLSTGGSRQFDTNAIVQRYESRMLMSALAQFLILGQNSVGTQALSSDFSDFFTMSVNALADIIADTFTHGPLAKLIRLNGWDAEGIHMEHSTAGDPNVAAIASALQQTADKITWMPEDEVWWRAILRMPKVDPEEIEAEREMRQQQAMEMMQQRQPPARPGQPSRQAEPDDDEEEPDVPEDEREENATTYYAAGDAPDDDKRRRDERNIARIIKGFWAGEKKRIVKGARQIPR